MEKAYRQYVSGSMFGAFGLRPAAGRLLTENDDVTPGAHPVAVLSYDYWTRRFGQDPKVVGRTFRMGDDIYQIVGVAERLHRHRNRHSDRHLRSHDDEESAHAREPRQLLAPDAGGTEAGRRSRNPFIRRCSQYFGRSSRSGPRVSPPCPNGVESSSSSEKLLLEPAAAGRSQPAARLPPFAHGARHSGGAGAADRVRQRRQSDDGPGGGARARNGAASFDRRGTMASGATGPSGKRLAGVPGHRSWPWLSPGGPRRSS